MTEKEVVNLMKLSKSAKEWNDNAREVKANFKGNYPAFWYSAIVQSGVMARTQNSWHQ